MIVKELLGHPQLGLNPVGFVDDDRAKHGHRLGDLPVLGPLARIPDFIRRHEVEELIIAMPRAPGAVVRQVVRAALESGRADAHGARHLRHHLRPGGGGVTPQGRDSGPAAARPDPDRPRPGAGARHRRDGAGHRRRRLDRQRALPPARAAGAGPDPAAGPRRELDLRRAGGADRALPQRDHRPDHRRRARPRAAAAGVRPVPPLFRVPRRRAQARPADGGQHRRGRDQQRARAPRTWPSCRRSTASSTS